MPKTRDRKKSTKALKLLLAGFIKIKQTPFRLFLIYFYEEILNYNTGLLYGAFVLLAQRALNSITPASLGNLTYLLPCKAHKPLTHDPWIMSPTPYQLSQMRPEYMCNKYIFGKINLGSEHCQSSIFKEYSAFIFVLQVIYSYSILTCRP